ncbi:alpha/beta hydrolase [Nocardioides sp. TRM66260-LWL]|uniref:alpha/beta hydrolase n=1 Tax=Nocardioides sp. TRM66260-LWL TaxID=2874478 RepID=UPI001CC640C6|nr:alpha/beta hydrolase [Nocardioides sp. TRM66260-LWL]MBZ5733471.1 alpha/beta hydrolase [Nocardioides sp. TRM66260-LWL]
MHPSPRSPRRSAVLPALAALVTLALGLAAAPATAAAPHPVAPQDDVANMAEAYGRITGPGGQLQNPAYLPALATQVPLVTVTQLLAQLADPLRLSVTPALAVPGWNVGNPLRAGWDGTRGRSRTVAFTNRYGARLAGTLYAPLEGARDPYTGRPLQAPYPAVVLTPGSVGGSQGMYRWLAQDLAERGYLVLSYDVQGQGTSETLPHTTGQAFPFCNPFDGVQGDPAQGTADVLPCPGVPFQQLSNFTTGTVDALDFLTSTPTARYPNPGSAGTRVDGFNPWWRLFDRSPLPRPTAPGRTSRIAVIGHSMGAFAASRVQGYDRRISTIVALDKLGNVDTGLPIPTVTGTVKPVVPALGVQSEYGFAVTPALLSGGSSLFPAPSPEGVDPAREKATGFDRWTKAGVDSMVLVPRASTHLEYTDIPLVLPASRYGQALTSAITQRWLDRYLRGGALAPLLAPRLRYLEPTGNGVWAPITLDRPGISSERFCSAYSLRSGARRLVDGDWTKVGC